MLQKLKKVSKTKLSDGLIKGTKAVWLKATGRGAQLPFCYSKHHELESSGRFRDHEIRDFLVPTPESPNFRKFIGYYDR
jgi:hypothetical protein